MAICKHWWVTSLIQRAAASQHRINEFLDVKPEIKSNKQNKEFHFNQAIYLKMYRTDKKILELKPLRICHLK